MPPRPIRHTRLRRRRPSLSSSGSASLASDDDEEAAHRKQRRPLIPRTKRRSITQLNELVRRKKEEQQRRSQIEPPVLAHEIDRKMDSLLNPHGRASDCAVAERRLIQVAVRCRPRRSTRPLRRAGGIRGDDGDSELSDSDTSSDEIDPRGSFIEYDLPNGEAGTTLPALSVPSHVLALGGHGPRRRFEFDFLFPPSMQQRDIYDASVCDAVAGVLRTAAAAALDVTHEGTGTGEGRGPTDAAHATIVAYGQTGTGKTYTMGMLQHADTKTGGEEHGIIPRAVVHVLSRIQAFNESDVSQQRGMRLCVSMSFLQIYLESIQDLFTSPHQQQLPGRRTSVQGHTVPTGLPVRLDPSTNVFYVAGLSELPIVNVDDARALLELGARNRVLAATARNKTSSRSHTLLTVSITHQRVVDGEAVLDGALHPPSTVSFVDLAGSERVEGALHFLHATRKRQELRIREAKFINRSLSALGSVIAALATQEDRRAKPKLPLTRDGPVVNVRGKPAAAAPHIRFRDSQLTKLLQSRLMNGNGCLVLIATIDDRPANLTETLSTLKFASQCRRVDLGRSHSKVEALRKQREESLLKQVFAEVKVMYEEREAALRRQHETEMDTLRGQLQFTRDESAAAVLSQKLMPQPSAPYIALCSLADLAHRNAGREVDGHPPIDSFNEESMLVAYVAELYRQVRAAVVGADRRVRSESPGSPTKCRQSQAEAPPTSPPRTLSGTKVERAAVEQAGDITARSKRKGESAASAAVDDAEFKAIARYLFASGLLQHVDVSSDEETGELFSQLQDPTTPTR